jgi:class 3 adenylate cyclase
MDGGTVRLSVSSAVDVVEGGPSGLIGTGDQGARVAGTVSINVVFTDLVGSTEMSSRLGPEGTEIVERVTAHG